MSRLLLTKLLIFSIVGNNCYAENTAPIVATTESKVILLDKGTEAPFKGYLFPEDKALQFRKELIELDNLKLMRSSYEKSIELYRQNESYKDDKIYILLDQNDKLAKAVYENKDRSNWEKIGWFTLGVLAVGCGAYAARKL